MLDHASKFKSVYFSLLSYFFSPLEKSLLRGLEKKRKMGARDTPSRGNMHRNKTDKKEMNSGHNIGD